MAHLIFRGIVKRFGDVTAVGDQVTWRVPPGAAIVFSADDQSTCSSAAEDRPPGAT